MEVSKTESTSQVVSKEIALKDVISWLDYKKVPASKREAYKDNIESLVNAVSEGTLVLNDDKSFTHHLIFPFGKEVTIDKLVYKPRIRVGDVYAHMNGIKTTDVDGRVHAYVCTLTGQPKEIVKQLDTEDIAVAQNIAIFFI